MTEKAAEPMTATLIVAGERRMVQTIVHCVHADLSSDKKAAFHYTLNNQIELVLCHRCVFDLQFAALHWQAT